MNALSPRLHQREAAWIAAQMRHPDALAGTLDTELGLLNKALVALPATEVIHLAATAAADGFAEAGRQLLHAWTLVHQASPGAFAVWFNLGVALAEAGRHADAATAYRNALNLNASLHEAYINLGLSLEALGRPDEALEIWHAAIPRKSHRVLIHNHIGRIQEQNGDLLNATSELRQSLDLDPMQPDVIQHWVHMRQRMTDWPILRTDLYNITSEQLTMNVGPLAALALFDDPALQTEIAAAWIARKVPAAATRLAPERGYHHKRIRVGYLSSDFCSHAMSFLIAETLEKHDRSHFEIFGYCSSPKDGSDLRNRIINSFDEYVEIHTLSDEYSAHQIRDDEIDILVDLNGLTRGARLGILRWKPAPVQITYLGYVGSVPIPELDWLICDRITIPEKEERHYLPRPLALTGCYQANDSKIQGDTVVCRSAEGLPNDRFVYCCFSHHYKITQEIFSAWISIAKSVPDSVMWLIDDGPVSRDKLTERWLAADLAPERLIFAPRVEPSRYRARMALADLFLDTSPYNAGTIASDALRMGLPLITVSGNAFAARMAMSLLVHMDLSELVAPDVDSYVKKAVYIGLNPQYMSYLKNRVGYDLWKKTIGDSTNFTRRLEAAYHSIRLRP